jgi:hypothetical protein
MVKVSYDVFMLNNSNVPACPMVQKSDPSIFRRAETGECRAMPVFIGTILFDLKEPLLHFKNFEIHVVIF